MCIISSVGRSSEEKHRTDFMHAVNNLTVTVSSEVAALRPASQEASSPAVQEPKQSKENWLKYRGKDAQRGPRVSNQLKYLVGNVAGVQGVHRASWKEQKVEGGGNLRLG